MPKERDRLFDYCTDDRIRFILFCGFHEGMRRNEIVEARPSWFNLSLRLVNIPHPRREGR